MLKVKRLRTADCVVGGFRYEAGRRLAGSFLLGLYDGKGLLHHVGFTSAIPREQKAELPKQFEGLISPPGFTADAQDGPSRWEEPRQGLTRLGSQLDLLAPAKGKAEVVVNLRAMPLNPLIIDGEQRKPSHLGSYWQPSPAGSSVTSRASIGARLSGIPNRSRSPRTAFPPDHCANALLAPSRRCLPVPRTDERQRNRGRISRQ